jgi:hypothetical protein
LTAAEPVAEPLAEAVGVALDAAGLALALPDAPADADELCGMDVNVSEGGRVPHPARLAAMAAMAASTAKERASIPVLMWRRLRHAGRRAGGRPHLAQGNRMLDTGVHVR